MSTTVVLPLHSTFHHQNMFDGLQFYIADDLLRMLSFTVLMGANGK